MKGKRTFGVLVTTVMALVLSSSATTGHWKKTDTGTSPQTAADYSDTSFWSGGVVPNGTADTAYFTNSYTLTRYVKLPDTLSLKQVYAKRGSTGCTTTFIGKNVTLAAGLNFVTPDALVQRWFSTVAASGDLTLIHSGIAGKLTVPGKLSLSGGTGLLDFGAFADSDDEVRTDDLTIGSLVAGSGDKIFRGSAALPEETNGVWTVTGGSPYLTWVSGPKGNQLAVGGGLQGTGIPSGAFVKRIFSDSYIEMSEAAAGAGGNASVTFDAFAPHVTVKIPSCSISGWPSFFFEKRSAEADMRVELGRLTVADPKYTSFPLKLTAGYAPATLVIRNASAFTGTVSPTKAHVEFDVNPNGISGFPQSRMNLGGTAVSCTARCCCSRTASAARMSNLSRST